MQILGGSVVCPDRSCVDASVGSGGVEAPPPPMKLSPRDRLEEAPQCVCVRSVARPPARLPARPLAERHWPTEGQPTPSECVVSSTYPQDNLRPRPFRNFPTSSHTVNMDTKTPVKLARVSIAVSAGWYGDVRNKAQ